MPFWLKIKKTVSSEVKNYNPIEVNTIFNKNQEDCQILLPYEIHSIRL